MRGKIAITGRIAVITKFGNAESWQSTPPRHCEKMSVANFRGNLFFLDLWIASLRSLMLTHLAMTKIIKNNKGVKND